MAALAIWILSVGLADMLAGPRGRWDGASPARPARATIALPVTAGVVGPAVGHSLPAVALLVLVTTCTGGAWLWLRHRGAEVLALLVLGAALLGLLATTGLWSSADGMLLRALERSALVTGAGNAEAVLLVVALGVFLSATGNGIVRGVLGQVEHAALEQEDHLKGGRVIGPLERLLIFGLGVSGQLTAAGLVVAAKSLLRYSEVRGHREDEASKRAELMSEYLLVGSLLSWTIALAAVGIIAAAT